MGKALIIAVALSLFGAGGLPGARAAPVVIGANVYDEGVLSKPAQDAEIERLAKNGVKTIRTGFSDKSAYFIIQAYKHGIGTDAVIYSTWGSTAKTKLRWSDAPLSGADPKGFAAWLEPMLGQLEAAGVRLTAMELGNEINTSGYNGDVAIPGSGRVLGLADLNNAKDSEALAIARGFRNYLRVLAALKDVRDHSKLNRATPVILAGIADWGLPGPKSWNGQLGVALPDTIAFLRQNGLDSLADGYGVHVYPTGDPKAAVPARVAELERKKIFSECRPAKPCWLTEWGIGNASQTCPIDDSKRATAVAAERGALATYARQGRLAAALWFTWAGLPGPKADPNAIFRCGALSPSGKLALAPL